MPGSAGPAAGLEILETLKRLRCSRSEPLPGRLGGLDVELLQKVAQKKGCLRSGGTLAAGSLNRAKSHTKKDAAQQIGGYGDISDALKRGAGDGGTLLYHDIAEGYSLSGSAMPSLLRISLKVQYSYF